MRIDALKANRSFRNITIIKMVLPGRKGRTGVPRGLTPQKETVNGYLVASLIADM